MLVNYCLPRAGPCLKLWPTLQGLANKYAGRFLLVNVNTDSQKQLAKQQGINSVPTVKLFINEQIKVQVHGADSEHPFRKLLDEHSPATTSPAIASAIMAYKQNDHDIAFTLLMNTMKSEKEIIENFLNDMAATATQHEFEKHMNLISKKVEVYGVPGFETIGYDDWFSQCENEFKEKLIKLVSYEGLKIIKTTDSVIMFKTIEHIETVDNTKVQRVLKL